MPFFDCGYYMQQEYIKPFVMTYHEDDYCSIALAVDAMRIVFVIAIFRNDSPNTRLFVSVYVDDPNKSYDDGVIYIRTRRAVAAQQIEELSETDVDRAFKNNFLLAMGKRFDPKELTFLVKRH
ncbi:hypothetical protein F5887DRAFT_1076105 [Amanita rubescens]|nr:hypothetical protein F5887DRAFT_1076105 [Amanita rubescens]